MHLLSRLRWLAAIAAARAGTQLAPGYPVGKLGTWLFAAGGCRAKGGNLGSFDEKWGVPNEDECRAGCAAGCVAAEFSVQNGYSRCELHKDPIVKVQAMEYSATCFMKDSEEFRAAWSLPLTTLASVSAGSQSNPLASYGLPSSGQGAAGAAASPSGSSSGPSSTAAAAQKYLVAQDAREKADAALRDAQLKEADARQKLREAELKENAAKTPAEEAAMEGKVTEADSLLKAAEQVTVAAAAAMSVATSSLEAAKAALDKAKELAALSG